VNRATEQRVISNFLSSTIGRVIATICLTAMIVGVVLADRYLKDWDHGDLDAQRPAAGSCLNGSETIPDARSAVPTPMESRSLPIDPDPIELSANSDVRPNALETAEDPDTNVEVRLSMPPIRWDGAIHILLHLNFTLCGNQPCF